MQNEFKETNNLTTVFPTIWGIVHRYANWVSFSLICAVILFLNLYKRDFIFYYDSLGYWSRSSYFIKDGLFSFYNYDFPLRGYLFSFIILIISSSSRMIGISSYIAYEVVMSLIYSSMFTIVIPDVAYLLYQKKVGVFPRLIFSIFTVYFWHGYFFYPLTDLPAFLLVLLGVYIFMRFQNHWWTGILTGCVWGGSALLRPSYQISLIPLLLWGWYFYRNEIHLSTQKVAVAVLTILAGMTLVFCPQIAINLYNYGEFSPFTQTQLHYKENDLFSSQLSWGLDVQKYETNVGASYPIPQVRFLDPRGESVLIRAGYKSVPYATSGQIGPDFPLKLNEYLELISKYPLDFIVIYARHFFNGLDIVYDTVYVTDIYRRVFLFRLLNYTIWFLVLIYLTHIALGRKLSWLNSQFILPIIFILPAMISIPTAVEVRFMLPLYIMAYALVAFWVLPEFFALDIIRKKKVFLKYLLWYSCFIVVCFMLSTKTYMHLEYGSYVLGAK